MASIALTSIGCIGYLDIGSIFMRAVFLFVAAGEKKEFLFPAKKAQDVRWEEMDWQNCVGWMANRMKFGRTLMSQK
jgi:hypothetical protein